MESEVYAQEIMFLRRLPWQSENVPALSLKIYLDINLDKKNPVKLGMTYIFILLKIFPEEDPSSDLIRKYELVAEEVINGTNYLSNFNKDS
ncbi:hypothetical protein ACP179_01280 (plasmid) [Xenorhabdus stockiae]|uniref:hypothetical protein n=1 Tax=Xenorhabdus stockiae TaxID=351614 RepID=UPI003CFB1C2C